jgi:hypothetical protein
MISFSVRRQGCTQIIPPSIYLSTGTYENYSLQQLGKEIIMLLFYNMTIIKSHDVF